MLPSLESRDGSTDCKTHEVIFPLLSTACIAPADRAKVTCLQKYVGQLSFLRKPKWGHIVHQGNRKSLWPDSRAVPSCPAGCAFYHWDGQEDTVVSSQASTAAQLMGGHLATLTKNSQENTWSYRCHSTQDSLHGSGNNAVCQGWHAPAGHCNSCNTKKEQWKLKPWALAYLQFGLSQIPFPTR